MLLDIISQTYQSRSKNIDSRELINFYTEFQAENSKNVKALIGTPGLRKILTINSGVGCRGMYTTSTNRMFGVNNTEFWELDSNENKTTIATIGTINPIVNFCDNGKQLLFVDGTTGYCYDLTTNTLTNLTGVGGFPINPTHCIMVNGYFLVNSSDTGNIFFSALYSGTSWNALDFFNAEFSADSLQGIAKTSNGNIWLIGTKSLEIWQHIGSINSEFQRINGSQREFGTIAKYSIVSNGNNVFFLGSESEGFASVMLGSGYSTNKISNPAIEYRLGKITNIQNAEGYTYTFEGHNFYIINFENEVTYCYDLTTNLWHKRGSLNTSTGLNQRQKNRGITFFNNKFYVGDFQTGDIYHLDSDYFSEDGNNIKRLIISPHMNSENQRLFFSNFKIDFEKGVGNSNISNPSVILDYSNDGGNNYNNSVIKYLGQIGQYNAKTIWNRCGSGRDRVWRIICSDQAKYIIVNVYYNIEGK